MAFKDEVEFLRKESRMCRSMGVSKCSTCRAFKDNNGKDIPCLSFREEYPEEYVQIVEEWCLRHPLNTRNTEKQQDNVPKVTSIKCDKCGLHFSSYCVGCSYELIGLNLIN